MAPDNFDHDLASLSERLAALDRLTDAKFVTMAQLVEAQADKVELALNASEKAIQKAESATEKAIEKAESATEKRFDAVNEFRAALADQTSGFITREVYEAWTLSSSNDRAALRKSIEELRLEQRTGQARIVGIAVGVSSAVALIGALISVVLRLATGRG